MKFLVAFFLLFSFPALACEIDFVSDYSADPTGVYDNTSAWNQAMSDEVHCLYIPAGEYKFFTQPDPILHAPSIIGDSALRSRLVRAYSGGRFIDIAGQSGGVLSRLAIIADENTSSGVGLRISVSSDYTVASWEIDSIRITGVRDTGDLGTFGWPLYIWGDGNSFVGWRNGTVRNVTIFGQESGAVYCKTCVSTKFIGLTAYGTNAKLWFVGGSRITISGSDIQGPIQTNAGMVASSLLGEWAGP